MPIELGLPDIIVTVPFNCREPLNAYALLESAENCEGEYSNRVTCSLNCLGMVIDKEELIYITLDVSCKPNPDMESTVDYSFALCRDHLGKQPLAIWAPALDKDEMHTKEPSGTLARQLVSELTPRTLYLVDILNEYHPNTRQDVGAGLAEFAERWAREYNAYA